MTISPLRDERAVAQEAFIENSGCPFCDQASGVLVSEVRYDTAERNRLLPNVTGRLFECRRCGVAYPSHQYRLEVFPQLYDKTFEDRAFLDDSPFQVIRKRHLKAILRRAYRHPLWRLQDAATLRVLQTSRPRSAFFYRTRHPRVTLNHLKSLLAPGGESKRYLEMLRAEHGLEVVTRKQIYGRPRALVEPVRSILGYLVGLAELATANLFHVRPYTLACD